jgi:hypothetical protein
MFDPSVLTAIGSIIYYYWFISSSCSFLSRFFIIYSISRLRRSIRYRSLVTPVRSKMYSCDINKHIL